MDTEGTDVSMPSHPSIYEREPSQGEMLGRYELLLPLASGGMGKVWIARLRGTRGFRKLVAVKTMQRRYEPTQMEQMLLQEATLASQVHHPNVVETLELGEQQGVMYLVMELVHGESLRYIMQEAFAKDGVPLDIAVNIVGQTCKGLQAVHELTDELGRPMGLVHRDISPANILVTYSGTVKIADFGVATTNSSTPSPKGEIKGKISYLAPEQIRGAELDARVDIFTTAIVLYLLTVRRHPFKGATDEATLKRILDDTPASSPSDIVADYPPALEAVLMRGLAKRRADRWPSASDFLNALNDAMPEAFGLNSERRTADFLHELLNERILERRETLRTAEALAEESGPREPVASALAGPREPVAPALAGPREPVASALAGPREPVASALPISMALGDPQAEGTTRARSSRRRWIGAGILAALAATLGMLGVPRRWFGRDAARSADEVALHTAEPRDRTQTESQGSADSHPLAAPKPENVGTRPTSAPKGDPVGRETKLSRGHAAAAVAAPKPDIGSDGSSGARSADLGTPSPVWSARGSATLVAAKETDSLPFATEPGRASVGVSNGAGTSPSGPSPSPGDPASANSTSVAQSSPLPSIPAATAAPPGNVSAPFAGPASKPSGPRMLPSRVAHGLLAVNPNADPYRVRLESGLEHVDQTFSATVQICVSVDGTVNAVNLLRSAGPGTDAKIQSVLLRWRYRPFVESGQALPFCYVLKYEIER